MSAYLEYETVDGEIAVKRKIEIELNPADFFRSNIRVDGKEISCTRIEIVADIRTNAYRVRIHFYDMREGSTLIPSLYGSPVVSVAEYPLSWVSLTGAVTSHLRE